MAPPAAQGLLLYLAGGAPRPPPPPTALGGLDGGAAALSALDVDELFQVGSPAFSLCYPATKRDACKARRALLRGAAAVGSLDTSAGAAQGCHACNRRRT